MVTGVDVGIDLLAVRVLAVLHKQMFHCRFSALVPGWFPAWWPHGS